LSLLKRVLDSTGLELRASDVLDSRIPWQAALLGGTGFTLSGKAVSKDTAIGIVAIYHCIDLLSADFGSLPQIVFRKKAQGRDILDGSELDYLLNVKPNYYQTPFEYKRMRAAHRLLLGESITYVDREGGRIKNLLPIHPHNVYYVYEDGGKIWYKIKNFKMPIPSDDILHVKDMTTEDGLRGKSRVLEYCREWTGRGIAINEYSSAYFGNGANPGLTFESDYEVDKSQRESLERSLREKHGGSDKSFNALIIPHGLRLASGRMKYNNQESQMIETVIQRAEEAAMLYNIPLNKMRVRSDNNSYNSQEHSSREYITDSLKPFVQGFQEEDNIKLVRDEEVGKIKTRFMLESKLKGDMKTQTEHVVTMVREGIYNRDEAREYLGKNPIPDNLGEEYTIPAQYMKLGQTPITEDGNKEEG
jgi:HK97 family phage portal protein